MRNSVTFIFLLLLDSKIKQQLKQLELLCILILIEVIFKTLGTCNSQWKCFEMSSHPHHTAVAIETTRIPC